MKPARIIKRRYRCFVDFKSIWRYDNKKKIMEIRLNNGNGGWIDSVCLLKHFEEEDTECGKELTFAQAKREFPKCFR